MKMNKYIETWYIVFITNKLHSKESVNKLYEINRTFIVFTFYNWSLLVTFVTYGIAIIHEK